MWRSLAASAHGDYLSGAKKAAVNGLPISRACDRVLFGKWSGTEVKIDGQELLIMKESDVMGVIEGTGATKKKAA